jgi:hypothetical protein
VNNIIRYFLAVAVCAVSFDLSAQIIYSNQSVTANAEIYGAGDAGLPDSSGVKPPEFNLPPFPTVLTMISATGLITLNAGGGSNDVDGVIVSGGYHGPTISGSSGYTVANAYGGISGISLQGGGSLVGVFEPATGPTGAAPANLNFTTNSGDIGTSFTSYSPALYQTFFIGDGLTGDGTGTVQQFIVPAGATRLFLGISDAPEFDGDPGAYGDNYGAFTVSFEIASAEVEIVSPQISGANFNFSFQGLSDQSYLIETSTNLVNGNWVTNTGVTGNGGAEQVSVPLTNSMEFFRVVTQQ